MASAMTCDLVNIDLEQRTPQTIDNPFGTRLLPVSQLHAVTHVSGLDNGFVGERGGTRTLDPMIKSHVLYHLSYALSPRRQALALPGRRDANGP
jgi:hypothetical protein